MSAWNPWPWQWCLARSLSDAGWHAAVGHSLRQSRPDSATGMREMQAERLRRLGITPDAGTLSHAPEGDAADDGDVHNAGYFGDLVNAPDGDD